MFSEFLNDGLVSNLCEKLQEVLISLVKLPRQQTGFDWESEGSVHDGMFGVIHDESFLHLDA